MIRGNRARRRGVAAAAAGLVAVLALTSCGGAAQDGASPSMAEDRGDSADAPGPPAAEAPGPGGDGDQGAAPDQDGGEAGGAWVDERSIIYTGSIVVRVADVDAAAARAAATATGYGGFVSGDTRSRNGRVSRAVVVLRVPSARFYQAVQDVSRLGEENSRDIHTEDVTEEVVDLETRIASAQASVDRTRVLMERAETIAEIVSVEAELSRRETTLARLQARQRHLADLTTLSTITAELLGPVPAEPEPESEEGPDLGFLTGLSAGWGAFGTAVLVALTVFGALLPWLLAFGIPAVAVVWWLRRRRPVAGPVTAPAPASAPASGPAPGPPPVARP